VCTDVCRCMRNIFQVLVVLVAAGDTKCAALCRKAVTSLEKVCWAPYVCPRHAIFCMLPYFSYRAHEGMRNEIPIYPRLRFVMIRSTSRECHLLCAFVCACPVFVPSLD
jgi:hypothetical protein